MTIKIKNEPTAPPLIRQVETLAGVDLGLCYQCKRCTSGCPVGKLVLAGPAEIIKKLHLNGGDELLDSEIIWTCASCETCAARCPMGIDIAAVMDALRQLAQEKGAAKPKGNVPLFNRSFLKTVKMFGRAYDMAMITAYKMGTLSFLKDTDKFPTMLKKKKIALLPPTGADRKTVKHIFKNTQISKGEKK